MTDDISRLSSLGSKHTDYRLSQPQETMLETFPNQFPDRDYIVTHETDEFTSLCPKTNQPDFATIRIEYVPDQLCIETKSLKLYLFAFRNEGSFMETITNRILADLMTACKGPRRMRVEAIFGARGGITTSVVAEYTQGEKT
jgi:7-cyano-7-deazaguanine reductase